MEQFFAVIKQKSDKKRIWSKINCKFLKLKLKTFVIFEELIFRQRVHFWGAFKIKFLQKMYIKIANTIFELPFSFLWIKR